MTKRVPFLLPMVLFIVTFAACHGPLLGTVTETYVNQNNVKQTLELTTKETVKGFVAGRSPNPQGSYTLLNDQKCPAEDIRGMEILTFSNRTKLKN
jgi:hypothetical protein